MRSFLHDCWPLVAAFALATLCVVCNGADQKPLVINPTTGKQEQLQPGNRLQVPDASGDMVVLAPGVQTASRVSTFPVMTGDSLFALSNSTLTSTCIPFATTNGILTNSTNLTYDATSVFVTNSGGSPYIGLIQSANNSSDGLSLRKRGTVGDATAAVASGAELGYHSFAGWDGSAYGRGAYVIATTTQAFTGSAHGCKYEIFTTPNGSTTNTLAVGIGQDQVVTASAQVRVRNATIGALGVATVDDTTPSTISAWDATKHIILGGAANSSTASALAVSYNQTSSEANMMSITPGSAWRNLNIWASNFRWNPAGSTTNQMALSSTGILTLAATTDSTSKDTGSIVTEGGIGSEKAITTGTNFIAGVAGGGLLIKEGSNAKMGAATLVGGTVTVNTTAVTANSRIYLTSQADGGTPGYLRVSGRVAATSFTITSGSGTDTSTVAWMIVEPAP